MEKYIKSNLRDFQYAHVKTLGAAFDAHSVILDTSDVGTGKTRTTCALAKWKQRRLFVICPKITISNWFSTAAQMQVEVAGISNYELFKLSKYYVTPNTRARDPVFEAGTLLVIDEAHSGKNYRTQTSSMLRDIKKNLPDGVKVVLLSATIADSIDNFRITAYMLGIAQFETSAYKAWMRRMLANNPGVPIIEALNKVLFPEYGSRMSVKTITNDTSVGYKTFPEYYQFYKFMIFMSNEHNTNVFMDIWAYIVHMCYHLFAGFKNNTIAAIAYDVSPTIEDEIMKQYENINQALSDLRANLITDTNPLTVILRSRQRIELLKTSIFIEQASEYLLLNKSVVMFVNFTETINVIYKGLIDIMREFDLGEILILRGGSDHAVIDKFQSGKAHCIIVNSATGSSGISLHHNNPSARPRVALISAPWSAITLKQILGRICRYGMLSDAEQYIIYCKGMMSQIGSNDAAYNDNGTRIGIEELIAKKVNAKLEFIDQINDEDIRLVV